MEDSERSGNEFEKYKLEIAASVNAVKERIKGERGGRELVEFKNYPLEKLKEEIGKVISKSLDIQDVGEIRLSDPPAHISCDFVLNVFELAKKMGKKSDEVARKIVNGVNEYEMDLVKNAEAVGAFVNLETHKKRLYQETLSKIMELGKHYGESDNNAGKVAIVDYSSPNIAKPIGVGHLRSTIIGQALSNIYWETGYSVIRDNHLGDWGTQFGKLIYAYKKWGDEGKIAENPMEELKDLYVKFHEYSKNNPDAEDSARELFAMLEKKDPEMVVLWKRFRDLSIEDFKRVYEQLGIKFDLSIGESYFTEESDRLVNECITRGLCRKDDSSEAVIVDQIGEIPSFLLRKQDGSSLYLARDLAALQFRAETFEPNTILYVVGNEQDTNFKQLLGLGKLAGYIPGDMEAKHVGFGMVLHDGKKMSTRKGTFIELEELVSQSIEKSKDILFQKNPNINPQELDKISKIIGIGAIIYNDLRQSKNKNVSFDWKRMLNLEGGSAVYLQYSYVRVSSILKKLTEAYGEISLNKLEKGDISFKNKGEFNLAKKLMMFPEIIMIAQRTDSPHHICVYLEELAQLFNSFYNEVSIVKTRDQKLRDSRVILGKGVALVIEKGLSLLNIKVPEKM